VNVSDTSCDENTSATALYPGNFLPRKKRIFDPRLPLTVHQMRRFRLLQLMDNEKDTAVALFSDGFLPLLMDTVFGVLSRNVRVRFLPKVLLLMRRWKLLRLIIGSNPIQP